MLDQKEDTTITMNNPQSSFNTFKTIQTLTRGGEEEELYHRLHCTSSSSSNNTNKASNITSSSSTKVVISNMPPTIHIDGIIAADIADDAGRNASDQSLLSAPPAPPHQHRGSSLLVSSSIRGGSNANGYELVRSGSRFQNTFGGVSKRMAYREIRRAQKNSIIHRRGWDAELFKSRTLSLEVDEGITGEATHLITGNGTAGDGYGGDAAGASPTFRAESPWSHNNTETDDKPWEALKEMFLENRINILLGFLPFACMSHIFRWSDGSVFILNFLAMVPLASMLGVFTEELAAHTNDVIGGLINATFGNAVELVVAIQALLHNDFRVVQASLIGSMLSNLLLVLGMCFFFGGIKYSEQTFVSQGAVASIALLALCGLTLLMPGMFGDNQDVDELVISRIGAAILILMYAQLLFFQLVSHGHLFEGGDDTVALIPFRWALIGLVTITVIVTILSEWLVGSIDGFCEEYNLGKSFVGVIVLPVVGNAVEHISAVTVAMKNKIDLALGGELSFFHFSASYSDWFYSMRIECMAWMDSRPWICSANRRLCASNYSSDWLVHRQRYVNEVSIV